MIFQIQNRYTTDLTAMSQSKQKTVERMTTYTAILASLFYVVTKQIGWIVTYKITFKLVFGKIINLHKVTKLNDDEFCGMIWGVSVYRNIQRWFQGCSWGGKQAANFSRRNSELKHFSKCLLYTNISASRGRGRDFYI